MTPYLLVCFLVYFSNCALADSFDFRQCYDVDMEDRMPLSIDNLIALVEKYEKEHSSGASDIAEALLNQYRVNGIIYCPSIGFADWGVHQTIESDKQELDDDLLKLNLEFAERTFTTREECGLHMMLSHSTDTYPHSGVDVIWEGTQNYGSSSSRSKRSTSSKCLDNKDPAEHPMEMGVVQSNAGPIATGILLSGIASMTSSSSYTIESLLGSSSTDYMPTEMKNKKINVFYGSTISGELAQGGILNGKVMSNNDFEVGPSGMFGNRTCCPRIFSLENNDQDIYSISRAELFASLDALLIKEAISNYASSSSQIKLSHILRMYYGDHGLFSKDIKSCNRLPLSNILGKEEVLENALNYMYAYQHYFADAREYIKQNNDNFDEIEALFSETRDYIYTEVRSFLQSYQKDDDGYYNCKEYIDIIPETQTDLIFIYSPTGSVEENEMQAEYITQIARNIGVGYKRSRMALLDPGYGGWQSPSIPITSSITKVLSSSRYSSRTYSRYQSSSDDEEEETEESSLTFSQSQLIDESFYSNVADWSCNFTDNLRISGSSQQDFGEVMDSLEEVFSLYYKKVRKDEDFDATKSLAVIWNLPQSFSTDEDDMKDRWYTFNMTYPDVSFIFVGDSSKLLSSFMDSENQYLDYSDYFVSTSGLTPEKVALTIVPMVLSSPRMFVYPNCDTRNSTSDDDDYYSSLESSHSYKVAVSPNRTTIIKVPPQNFRYSEHLTLSFHWGDTDENENFISLELWDECTCAHREAIYREPLLLFLIPKENKTQSMKYVSAGFWEVSYNVFPEKEFSVCVSRENKVPQSTDRSATYCNEGVFELDHWELCGRYLNQCAPIYIAVTGIQTTSSSCTGDSCLYPNQAEFEMSHQGMTCGSAVFTINITLLIFAIFLIILKIVV